MIKIQMKNVASYKDCATLETDKRVNLIYGINGTGKTQLSNCLKKYPNLENTEFKDCKIDGLTNEKILVFNQNFIYENFYMQDKQNPIFTLSRTNKNIVEKLEKIKKIKVKIENHLQQLQTELKTINDDKTNIDNSIKNSLFEIKQKYEKTNFDYCLSGFKTKENLFTHFKGISLTNIDKTIDDLTKESSEIQAENATPIEKISLLDFSFIHNVLKIEKNQIFKEAIVGNENSQIAEFINKLGNSDWVKVGQNYINETNKCPFCQQETINENFKNELKTYFDETFDKKMYDLQSLKQSYEILKTSILPLETYKTNKFINEFLDKFTNLYNELVLNLSGNLANINNKLEKPNNCIDLNFSKEYIKNFNNFLKEINEKIRQYNTNLENKENIKKRIRDEFWQIMRKNYNEFYVNYTNENDTLEKEKQNKSNSIEHYRKLSEKLDKKNKELQTQTQNLEKAIDNINNNLKNLGITEFQIISDGDNEIFYKITRTNEICNNEVFKTLSEGEKTIISFLYFIELCKGTDDKNETNNDKIIVIDDPISSLSNNYVFDVAHFIKAFFIEDDNFKQIFILTHNLYFFHEMIKVLDNKKGEKTEMFRIKRQGENNYSMICKLNKNEILNDYQMLWDIYKNKENYTDLILPNVMRNIIERFFSFLGNEDKKYKTIDNLYKNANYHAFIRFINRKSHSDRINFDETYDISTIDMQNFINAFKEIFKSNETYKEHYEKMTGDILA